jgi:hypothetical protein
MRSGKARRFRFQFIASMATAPTSVGAFAFYIAVTDYCEGRGEPTRAELIQLETEPTTAHAPP